MRCDHQCIYKRPFYSPPFSSHKQIDFVDLYSSRFGLLIFPKCGCQMIEICVQRATFNSLVVLVCLLPLFFSLILFIRKTRKTSVNVTRHHYTPSVSGLCARCTGILICCEAGSSQTLSDGSSMDVHSFMTFFRYVICFARCGRY